MDGCEDLDEETEQENAGHGEKHGRKQARTMPGGQGEENARRCRPDRSQGESASRRDGFVFGDPADAAERKKREEREHPGDGGNAGDGSGGEFHGGVFGIVHKSQLFTIVQKWQIQIQGSAVSAISA